VTIRGPQDGFDDYSGDWKSVSTDEFRGSKDYLPLEIKMRKLAHNDDYSVYFSQGQVGNYEWWVTLPLDELLEALAVLVQKVEG
jgi:hypothetical protein